MKTKIMGISMGTALALAVVAYLLLARRGNAQAQTTSSEPLPSRHRVWPPGYWGGR